MVACIDIGSNTTRLLVAELRDGRLCEVAAERSFTRIGARTRAGRIATDAVTETAGVVAGWCAVAAGHGAQRLSVVATAAVRDAHNGRELTDAVAARCGRSVRVLTGDQEAALSFAGACHALGREGVSAAVADVGGGSTEIAVGVAGGDPSWTASIPLGSSSLRALHLDSDPPTTEALRDAERHVAGELAAVDPPPADLTVAVGGTALALFAVAGPELDASALDEGLRRVTAGRAAQVAEDLGLPGERAALLPAGVTILRALADRLGGPLTVVPGGLREGVALELAAEA